ncbi:DUF982 domain-containing protein [Allomesorhizobium alhagi]|uniref:Uncharacterized protein n=1 Tax=Mesorhizobium alhagi CCNWXJ12-2 TaxID=1107882 RepID=H0I0Z2_9HYPH|nr:DUF982 domain-containing protein [Mesorhizobium alhagi]EHK53354.1 hypothetical protein MAXJ12_30647 [Mesorhizobium alhagi CCNWXJ12-2]
MVAASIATCQQKVCLANQQGDRNLGRIPRLAKSNGIALMDKLQFILPIRIVTEWAAPVKEIYSVEEALAFLDNYPKGRESPVYQRAVNSCFCRECR